MSWVLILTSTVNARPPAVVGGYPTRESAELAGELATRPILQPAESTWQWDSQAPCYQYFTVIPGAAVDEPLGVTHGSSVDREDNGKIINRIHRYGVDS